MEEKELDDILTVGMIREALKFIPDDYKVKIDRGLGWAGFAVANDYTLTKNDDDKTVTVKEL